MQRKSRLRSVRFWVAVVLLLSVSAMVVATGMTPSQVATAAMEQEVKDTSTKQLAIENLTATPLKVKPKAATAVADKKDKKRKGKQEADPLQASEPTALTPEQVDALNMQLAALIQRAENERMATKAISQSTKSEITQLKDTLGKHYNGKAEDARIAGNADVALFYESAGKKLDVVVNAVLRDKYESADFQGLGKTLEPESIAMNNVLRKVDRSKISKDQIRFLRERVVKSYVESLQVALIILNQIMSLISQVQHALNDPVSFAVGCALTMAVRASQGQNAFIPPEIEVIRNLTPVLQMKKKIYKDTIALLSDITGETINLPFMKDEEEKPQKLIPTDK